MNHALRALSIVAVLVGASACSRHHEEEQVPSSRRTASTDTTRAAEFDPALVRIVATGDNPAWVLSISNKVATLITEKDGRQLFVDGEWGAEEPGAWFYSAHRKYDGGEDTVSMTLRESVCIDSLSGAKSPFTAGLIRGESHSPGCAVSAPLRPSSPDSTE